MSADKRDRAIDLMREGRFADALVVLRQLISQNPKDYGLLSMAGQCCRFTGDLKSAISYLKQGVLLSDRDPPVLQAISKSLGIAFQLDGQFQAAAELFVKAIDLDPYDPNSYNSLALTQSQMGEFEKSLHNYDAGLKALGRRIAKGMVNLKSNMIYKHRESRHNLWAKYAADAALHLAATTEGIDGISWLTGEQAIEEERHEIHAGLYWTTMSTDEGKTVLSFLPNYFNTFRETLLLDPIYSVMMDNMGLILEDMGKHDEAERYSEEAKEFTPI